VAKHNLTRQQAVRGQLDTAVELVILGKDSVSAHLLASAASTVLRGLAKHAGHVPFDTQLEVAIRPEKIKVWRDAVNRHYNFFKHADRDAATDSIEFDPEITLFKLLASTQDYRAVYGAVTVPMGILLSYMVRLWPDMFNDEYRAHVEPALALFDEGGGSPLECAS